MSIAKFFLIFVSINLDPASDPLKNLSSLPAEPVGIFRNHGNLQVELHCGSRRFPHRADKRRIDRGH